MFGFVQLTDMTEKNSFSDRLTYATFPAPLKSAMKAVASGYGWGRESWALQTDLIHRSLLTGTTTEADIIAGYTQPGESA